MEHIAENFLRDQLQGRRQKLEAVIPGSSDHAQLSSLLREVDSALERMEKGSYGICEACREPVETERFCSRCSKFTYGRTLAEEATAGGCCMVLVFVPVIGCSGRLWSSDLVVFVLVVFMVFFFDLVLGPVYRPSPVIQPARQGGRREESPEGTTFGPPDGLCSRRSSGRVRAIDWAVSAPEVCAARAKKT